MNSRRKPRVKEKTNLPHDEIVEIKRNLVENALLDGKHWVQNNPTKVRYGLIIFLGGAIALLALSFAHRYISQEQSETYYKLVEELEEVSLLSESTDVLNPLAKSGLELCNSTWTTNSGANGCLLAAQIYLKTDQKDQAILALENYLENPANSTMEYMARHMLATLLDQTNQVGKAEKQYQQLIPVLRKIEREDTLLLAMAEMYIRVKNDKKAKEMIDRLEKGYPNNQFTDRVRAMKMYLALKSKK